VLLPPAVASVTGLTERDARRGCDVAAAAGELAGDANAVGERPTPAIAHYARFEQSLLPVLSDAQSGLALDLFCTHAIARRFYPELPRCGLRALAGYLGAAVGPLRRSADHVEATAFVWRALAQRLAGEGVDTWEALHAWLTTTPVPTSRGRAWPMPRAARLALPRQPGVYRFLRAGGEVLYVGKAASLHDRVNSYFRRQHGTPERLLEMLTQARDVSVEAVPTALEAALLECDEIKRHRAPYNLALTDGGRALVFASADLCRRGPAPEATRPLGPFASTDTLDRFAALVAGRPEALGSGRWMPDASVFQAGLSAMPAIHRELAAGRGSRAARLLRLGTRLWREGRRDGDLEDGADAAFEAWTEARVQREIEWLAIRAAWARRRARWLARLADATAAWRESDGGPPRLLIVDNGVVTVLDGEADAPAPMPPGHARRRAERLRAFTVASHDRLRVLTTELKRLVAHGAPVSVRLGPGPAIGGERLRRLLAWL
jgi:DNA polymerase-3 subunit epsilon